MRVPDISSTAGYAANVFSTISIQHASTSTNPLFTALGNEHNKFDNRSPTEIATATTLYYRDPTPSTNYASTADEFVQKALSSTPTTEYSLAFALNDNLSHYCCGTIPKKLIKNSTEESEECLDKEANSSGNTYKSFKEIFNTNKSFYEDCVRDFENINILKNGREDQVNDLDVDPIKVINTPESRNSNIECAQYYSKNPFDNDFNQYSVTKCEHLEQQQQHNIAEKSKDHQDLAAGSHHLADDNDYDDHSMIDLCSETKSNYDSDEKDDEFLTSASSSSGSVHTQKHSFFPRGIINPNYPGFQHLAHTLSEHFVASSPSDSYDSDMSEYEMDLSADSFDSLTEDKPQIELNNFNNNTTQSITMNPAGHLSNRHENFDYIHEEEDEFYFVDGENGHQCSFDDDQVNRNSHQSDNNPFNITDLEDGVQSKLTLLETEEYEETNDTKQPSKDHMQVSITPDILIKNYHLQLETQFKKENRPDLLRGVSPHSAMEPMHVPLTLETQQPCHSGFIARSHADIKDEMSFGLTPVDIIGDFGQEVEREFGLLVSGYRRLVDIQDNMNTAMEDLDKVSDAVLSVAKDQIDSSKFLEAFNKQTEETHKSQMLQDLADDNAVDLPMTTLQSPDSSPKKSEPPSLGNHNHSSSSVTSESRLKTKYQKSSYDDRQLPPVAIEYKRCQQNSRVNKKSSSHSDKSTKVVKPSHSKPSIANRLFHSKRSSKSDKSDSSSCRKRDEAELHKYQQLISDKEEILSNSKYAKLSSWAQHLKNSVKDRGSRGSTDLISPSALELFDAYKFGTEIDMDQLQQHLKMAKEIERQPRQSVFWEIDVQNMTDNIFKETFRMNRKSFTLLCRILASMEREDTNFQKCITLPKRIAIALTALKSSAEYLTIAHLFGVGKATVCVILKDFCEEVWRGMSMKYMSPNFLTSEEVNECVRGFEALGFPQCIGAIDGCHIAVHPPGNEGVDYFNYKGWYSVVLLAVVDYRYRFTYINVGSPGRCNDSSIFEKSRLHQILCNGLLNKYSSSINDSNIAPFLIGDSAFRLSEYMMKPYPFSTAASEYEKTYNYNLSKCRRVVENAFGHLKARFRRIGKGIDNHICNVNKIIKACCVLHNFLNAENDAINEKWIDIEKNFEKTNGRPQPDQVQCFDLNVRGIEIRNCLANLIFNKNSI